MSAFDTYLKDNNLSNIANADKKYYIMEHIMRSFRYISVFAEETFALIWDDEIFELNKQMAQAIKDNNQQNQEQLENKMIEIIKTDIIKFKFAERELFPIATEFFKLLTC